MRMRNIIKIIIFAIFLALPIQLHSREFLNTIMHINFGVMFGFPFGDIINYERRFSIEETYRGSTENVRPDHYDTSFGITIDLSPFPPVIAGEESHALKFGLRGVYRFHYYYQKITIREDASYVLQGTPYKNTTGKDINFGGNLLTMQSWMIGPVIHYAPFIDSANFEGA